MMHIPLKTNIAAGYITCEARRQDIEGWEEVMYQLRNGDSGGITALKKKKKKQLLLLCLFAFFLGITEKKNISQKTNLLLLLRLAGYGSISPTQLFMWTPSRWKRNAVSGVHLKSTFCIFWPFDMWWRRAAFHEALAEVIKMPSASCQDLLVLDEMETIFCVQRWSDAWAQPWAQK